LLPNRVQTAYFFHRPEFCPRQQSYVVFFKHYPVRLFLRVQGKPSLLSAQPTPISHTRNKAYPSGPPNRGPNKRSLDDYKAQRHINQANCLIKRPSSRVVKNGPPIAQGGHFFGRGLDVRKVIICDVTKCPMNTSPTKGHGAQSIPQSPLPYSIF